MASCWQRCGLSAREPAPPLTVAQRDGDADRRGGSVQLTCWAQSPVPWGAPRTSLGETGPAAQYGQAPAPRFGRSITVQKDSQVGQRYNAGAWGTAGAQHSASRRSVVRCRTSRFVGVTGGVCWRIERRRRQPTAARPIRAQVTKVVAGNSLAWRAGSEVCQQRPFCPTIV